MPDLNLDLIALRQLANDLTAVINEFNSADAFSDQVAEATGHDELKGHVRDFAHKWNDKRAKMTEAVTDLQQKISAISDGFTQVDSELSKALTEAAQENGPYVPPEPPTMNAVQAY